MWYPAIVNDPPDVEPVTRAQAKKQTYVDFDDDDTLLDELISAARDHAERYTGTRIPEQIVTLKCDGFEDFAWFPEAPLQSVAVTYVDTAGAVVTLPDTVYEVRAEGLEAAIVLKYGQTWPAIQSGSRISVVAVVGYEVVPDALKHALLLFIAKAFEQRETEVSADRSSFDDLLSNFRR